MRRLTYIYSNLKKWFKKFFWLNNRLYIAKSRSSLCASFPISFFSFSVTYLYYTIRSKVLVGQVPRGFEIKSADQQPIDVCYKSEGTFEVRSTTKWAFDVLERILCVSALVLVVSVWINSWNNTIFIFILTAMIIEQLTTTCI